MNNKTIFSKIIDGEVPAALVHEDEHCVVLMDAFPSVPGQVLVVPRDPVSYWLDLPEPLHAHLWSVAKRVGQALDATFETSRTCVAVEGFEVPHVHLKLYPLPPTATDLVTHLAYTEPADPNALQAQAAQIKTALL